MSRGGSESEQAYGSSGRGSVAGCSSSNCYVWPDSEVAHHRAAMGTASAKGSSNFCVEDGRLWGADTSVLGIVHSLSELYLTVELRVGCLGGGVSARAVTACVPLSSPCGTGLCVVQGH